MRFLSLLVMILLAPVLSNASTMTYEFTATLQSQQVFSRSGPSTTDAPPLTGAFSKLPIGASLSGVAQLSYDVEKVRGPLPQLWTVRGKCSLGGVDCGFGGDVVFNAPPTKTDFFNTGLGSFTITDHWNGTMFDIGRDNSVLTYMGTASDGYTPYEAVFGLGPLRITGVSDEAALKTTLAAVPLPAGLPLLLGGLGALAVFRRRCA